MTIPTPTDAVSATDWIEEGTDRFRLFDGQSWHVPMTGDVERFNLVTRLTPDIRINIRGVQFADGAVHRWVAITHVPVELPAETAVMFAESLAAANANIASYK